MTNTYRPEKDSTFTVNAESEAIYDVTFTYNNGETDNANVILNGEENKQFGITFGDNQNTTVALKLKAGMNTLKFEGAEATSVYISRRTPWIYQAENAELNGVKQENNHLYYNGIGFVSAFESVGNSVKFITNIAYSGTHTINLKYSCVSDADRTISLYINGQKVKQITLQPTESWDEWKEIKEGIRTYIILGVMLIIICLIAAVVISLKSTGFLNEFIHAMESVRNRNYDIRIKEYKNAEINSLGRAFNEMMDELRELIRNKYESQILLNEMEIRFLQHQMNPHFLFNVLLTIQIKAKRSGNETIYKMVSKLSALLRASIYTNNVDRITVGEELEYTEFYLYLQKMRFEDRFFYKIIVEDEELKKSIIPKFVIEPIVENAVIHGIENIENEGVIRIVLKKMGTDLLVTVQDNGAGFDVKEYFNSLEQAENGSSREKIGLKNVDLRLRHIYGEEYRIKIKSKINTGTTIYIKIPIEEREENV